MANKNVIVGAWTIEGNYNDKPYCSGRLVCLSYPDGAKNPSYVAVNKCSTELVDKLRGKFPITDATLYFDRFKNVVGIKDIS